MYAAGLRLAVENLGPIEHADIDLRPLTVLIGKNNTGKTYLAQALYAAHKAANSSFGSSEILTKADINSLQKDLLQSNPEKLFDLPSYLEIKANMWINSALDQSGNILKRNLQNYFGVSEMKKITRWDQPDEVAVELHLDRKAIKRTRLFSSKTMELSDNFKAPKESFQIDTRYVRYDIRFWERTDNKEDIEIFQREFAYHISQNIWVKFLDTIDLSGNSHYLPAGRSGLLNAWTDVVKLRFELDRERFGLSRFPESSLGGVALDFISSLAGIIGPRHRPIFARNRKTETLEDTGPLALLTELMGGKIRAGPAEEMVPTLEYQPDGHRIAVHHASSMVADLAPLAMWIEHLVSRNDLLIIDEPESHLHPEAIRLVARVLVGLVNREVRVVCATHSSVLLHELSNCILRSQLPQTCSDEINTTGNDHIALEKIAVYRFQRQEPTGPVNVNKVDIDPNWGIPEDEYVKVASELSDETAKLIDQLT